MFREINEQTQSHTVSGRAKILTSKDLLFPLYYVDY